MPRENENHLEQLLLLLSLFCPEVSQILQELKDNCPENIIILL